MKLELFELTGKMAENIVSFIGVTSGKAMLIERSISLLLIMVLIALCAITISVLFTKYFNLFSLFGDFVGFALLGMVLLVSILGCRAAMEAIGISILVLIIINRWKEAN